jgi:hypothetical protein
MRDLVFFLGRHFSVCVVVSVWLKDRIPPEVGRTAGKNDLPRRFPTKYMNLFARASCESEYAESISGFVVKPSQEFIQALVL